MPTIVGNNGGTLTSPQDFVADGWYTFKDIALDAIAAANDAANRVAQFTTSPIEFTVSFDDVPIGNTLTLPAPPTAPDITFNGPTIPAYSGSGVDTTIILPDAPDAPDFSGLGAIEPPSNTPGDFLVPAPTRPDVDLSVSFPAAPALTLPAAPTLFDLALPDAPTVNLPLFTAHAPTFNKTAPSNTFAFREVAYTPAVLNEVTSEIKQMLNGVGLPPDVEQQLYDRARSREEETAFRALQEVDDDFGSRGFSEPSGVLAKRRDMARETSRKQMNQFSREVYTQSYQVFMENLRFAVAQGIAVEGLNIQLHNAVMDRSLQAARAAADVEIAVFNASVSAFSAQVQAFGVQADAFRVQLQAELSKLDKYKALIEAQAQIGQLNQVLVSQYEAGIRAVVAQADLYKTQVDAADAEVRAKTAQLEAYRSDVSAYSAQVQAYSARWDGYRASVDAYSSKLRAYSVAAEVYNTRVTAWGHQADVQFKRVDAELQKADGQIRAYTARLDGVRAALAAESERVKTLGISYQTKASVFESSAKVAQVESETRLRESQLAITRESTKAEIQLKNAELELNNLIQNANLTLEALRGIMQARVQMAASAMSGVNFGATYSGSLSDSFSKSINFSYSGDTTGPAAP